MTREAEETEKDLLPDNASQRENLEHDLFELLINFRIVQFCYIITQTGWSTVKCHDFAKGLIRFEH